MPELSSYKCNQICICQRRQISSTRQETNPFQPHLNDVQTIRTCLFLHATCVRRRGCPPALALHKPAVLYLCLCVRCTCAWMNILVRAHYARDERRPNVPANINCAKLNLIIKWKSNQINLLKHYFTRDDAHTRTARPRHAGRQTSPI